MPIVPEEFYDSLRSETNTRLMFDVVISILKLWDGGFASNIPHLEVAVDHLLGLLSVRFEPEDLRQVGGRPISHARTLLEGLQLEGSVVVFRDPAEPSPLRGFSTADLRMYVSRVYALDAVQSVSSLSEMAQNLAAGMLAPETALPDASKWTRRELIERVVEVNEDAETASLRIRDTLADPHWFTRG